MFNLKRIFENPTVQGNSAIRFGYSNSCINRNTERLSTEIAAS